MRFDWDRGNTDHIARHNVRPDEAEEAVLDDPIDLTFETVDGEDRTVQVGHTKEGRILVVVTTWRGDAVRVITAFEADRRMAGIYLAERHHEP